jgi:hypothetical protein
MAYKLLLATAVSLGLGTGMALAQSTTTAPSVGATPDSSASAQLPAGWEGAIGDAFFSDTDSGTLRSEEEVRANFNSLSAEQQAQVRSHCETLDTAAASPGMTGSDTGATDDNLTTGSTVDSTVPMSLTASIEQACGWIDNM